jgi:phosphatidylglycerol lysyltransferase
MAEEAILDLGSFSLAGGKRAALRSMVHKVARLGLVVRRYDRKAVPEPALDAQLEEISEEWLAEKRLGEMGFSLGRFSLESLDDAFVFVALDGERVVAFTSWRSYRAGRAGLLDLMRRRKGAPSGTMDLLVARSLEELRAAGLSEASLASAPLANTGGPRGGLEKGVALLFESLNAFYGYKNLFQFKKKFAPRWEGRYLVYPRGVELPRVAYALAGVHGAAGLRRLVLGR